jgi:hypothetical protein
MVLPTSDGQCAAAGRDSGGVEVGWPRLVEEHEVSRIANREIPLFILAIHDT